MPGLVPGIHVLTRLRKKDVDGRDKPGHDEIEAVYDFARVTASPSSFTNDPAGWSSRSSTASDGRQSRTPFGVTTIGRLIRIGCASIKSISSSSLHLGSASPSSA